MEAKSFQIQIPTETLTETNVAVITTVGVISSFFIGMSFLFAALQLNPIADNPQPIANQPLKISDVVSVGLERTQKYTGSIGIFLSSDTGTLFGIINQGGSLQDGNTASAPTSLWVGVNSPNDAIALSLSTDQGIVHVCVPENTTYASASNDRFSLIKEASAQVFVGKKYYVDVRGNTYEDSQLTKKLNPGDCLQQMVKSFAPTAITGGSITPSTTQAVKVTDVQFFRSTWQATAKWGGVISQAPSAYVTPVGSRVPLHILFQANGTTESQTLPAATMSVVTPAGSKKLCFPQTTIQGLGATPQYLYRVDYFFDNQGYPYRDALLTSRVACTFPSTCTCTTGEELCCTRNVNTGGPEL